MRQTSELYRRECQFVHQVQFCEWFVSSVSQFIHLQAILIYYHLHSRLPHSFHYNLTGTQLRGCVRILYIHCSVFIPVRYIIDYCYRFPILSKVGKLAT